MNKNVFCIASVQGKRHQVTLNGGSFFNPVLAINLNEPSAVRNMALFNARYPEIKGKLAVWRCQFAMAPAETFELVTSEVPEDVAAMAAIVAKHEDGPGYWIREKFIQSGVLPDFLKQPQAA